MQNGHVHWFSSCAPGKALPLLAATLPGREGGGDVFVAAINCSTVAQCSDLDHSIASSGFLVLIASSRGPMESFIGNMSMVAMYKSKWKSLIAVRNSLGLNWDKYWLRALKSWMYPSTSLFSTGNTCLVTSVFNVYWGFKGVEAGTSTRRYSTGRGLARRDTSFPYVSFS